MAEQDLGKSVQRTAPDFYGNPNEPRGVSYPRGRQRGLAGEETAMRRIPILSLIVFAFLVSLVASPLVGERGWRHHRRSARLRSRLS